MVTPRERRHFEAVAAAKRSEHVERALEALREPAMKRIIEGLELGAAGPQDPAAARAYEERTRGKAELHARARRLGLSR